LFVRMLINLHIAQKKTVGTSGLYSFRHGE